MKQILNGFNTSDEDSRNIKKLKSGLICLDLKGAFDAIRNELVLGNLLRLGINESYVRIERQWIPKREFVVRYRSETSRVFWTEVGLPHGSVFPPFLFACAIDKLLTEFARYVNSTIWGATYLAINLSAFRTTCPLQLLGHRYKIFRASPTSALTKLQNGMWGTFRDFHPTSRKRYSPPATQKLSKNSESETHPSPSSDLTSIFGRN